MQQASDYDEFAIILRNNHSPTDSYPTDSSILAPRLFNAIDPWIEQFMSSRGNEYFCEIDEDYLTDRFNLTGLNADVQYYQYALDLVTDVFDLDCDDDMREQIEKSARHLYGLVHARYITTIRGLAKMVSCAKSEMRGQMLISLHSSTSTKRQTLADALASCAGLSRCSQQACPTSPMSSPSSSSAANVRTSTIPNHPVTPASMALTSAPRFKTFSTKCTRH